MGIHHVKMIKYDKEDTLKLIKEDLSNQKEYKTKSLLSRIKALLILGKK
jgi:hypothetical protein